VELIIAATHRVLPTPTLEATEPNGENVIESVTFKLEKRNAAMMPSIPMNLRSSLDIP
jgi:hypothetical protein